MRNDSADQATARLAHAIAILYANAPEDLRVTLMPEQAMAAALQLPPYGEFTPLRLQALLRAIEAAFPLRQRGDRPYTLAFGWDGRRSVHLWITYTRLLDDAAWKVLLRAVGATHAEYYDLAADEFTFTWSRPSVPPTPISFL